jgi:TolA-binding protein
MARKMRLSAFFTAILLCVGSMGGVVSAQSLRGTLQEGIALYGTGDYDKAIVIFNAIISDAKSDVAQKGSAYFWAAKSAMSLGTFEEAQRDIEVFLANYQGSSDYPEAVYQKGRLLLMQEEYEGSIKIFQGFIAHYPQSPFLSNAYFWVGECLYNLGKLDEARALYEKVVQDYPTSFKVEAAQYRLSLIDLARREVELTKLLKWSHEDYLRNVEEYQRRDKNYEQLIADLQKKLAAAGQTPAQATLDALQKELDKKDQDMKALLEQIEDLRAQVSAAVATSQAKAQAAETSASAVAQPGDAEALKKQLEEIEKQKLALAQSLRLLELKEQALDLKEKYLEMIEANVGGRQ